MLISRNNCWHLWLFTVNTPDTGIILFYFVTLILRVKHPNILQLVDVFETKKEYFLFLEL